jgi:hypothetical protein
VAGRELRISGHPESDRVVLSIWQDGRCQATVRLARSDVPEVTRALVAGLVPVPSPFLDEDPARTGTVHRLHPDTSPRTGAISTLREATDRFATTVIAKVRRFTSGS